MAEASPYVVELSAEAKSDLDSISISSPKIRPEPPHG